MPYSFATVAYGIRNGTSSASATSVAAAMRIQSRGRVTAIGTERTMTTDPKRNQWMFDSPFIRNAPPNSAARPHDGRRA